MKPKTRAIVYAILGTLFALSAIFNVVVGGALRDTDGGYAMGQMAGFLLIPGLFLWRAWVNWNLAEQNR